MTEETYPHGGPVTQEEIDYMKNHAGSFQRALDKEKANMILDNERDDEIQPWDEDKTVNEIYGDTWGEYP